MSASEAGVVDRVRRVAAAVLGRSLRDVSDPGAAPRTAAALGAAADPPIADPASLAVLAGVLAGDAATAGDPDRAGTRNVTDRLTAGLGLPPDTFDPGTDFLRIERDLITGFLRDRGVVEVRPCRGRGGWTALLEIAGFLDRAAAGTGAA